MAAKVGVGLLLVREIRQSKVSMRMDKLYEIPALLVPNFFINTKANYCHRCPDLLTYFELVLFSYLYCNNDMHLKDLSFMH